MPDLGKLLFPRLQRDQRLREMRILLAGLLIALVIAGITTLMMIKMGRAH